MATSLKVRAVAIARILSKSYEHVAHYVQMSDIDPELMVVTDRFVALDSCFGHLDEDLQLMSTPFPPMRRAHGASGRLCSNS
jgi:hypothetical protein